MLKLHYITLRSILCPTYNEPDQPGITNFTKRINEKASKTQDMFVIIATIEQHRVQKRGNVPVARKSPIFYTTIFG